MKKILLFTAISFLAISCDESNINFTPYNAVTDGVVLKTPSNFTQGINGALAYMIKRDGENGYGEELLIDSEVCTDNVIISPQGRQTNKDGFRFTDTPINSHFDFFNSAYKASYYSNFILSKLDALPAGDFKDNIEGQARFIRAINHFELLINYAKIPTQSADAMSSLGVYYMDVLDPSAKPARTTVQDGYDKVIADLNIAKDKIGVNAGAPALPGKAAVYALLSRVYLYMGQWQNSLDNANLAIANFSGGDVATRAQFYTSAANGLWEDTTASGVIFKLRIDQIDGTIPGVAYSQAVGTQTKSEYVVSKELYDRYIATDIRKAAYIKTGLFSGKNYNNISKYDGRGTGVKNVVDIKVLRIEDVYLMKSEDEYNLTGGGLASLDKVRSNRYSGFVSGGETGQALYDAIMLQRRLEFAFEMDRFYTLKRLNLPVNRSATDGHYADGTGTPAEVTNLPAGDFRWEFPIPQYEIDNDFNLQQNPGY